MRIRESLSSKIINIPLLLLFPLLLSLRSFFESEYMRPRTDFIELPDNFPIFDELSTNLACVKNLITPHTGLFPYYSLGDVSVTKKKKIISQINYALFIASLYFLTKLSGTCDYPWIKRLLAKFFEIETAVSLWKWRCLWWFSVKKIHEIPSLNK